MNRLLRFWLVGLSLLASVFWPALPVSAQETHLVIVVGLGGDNAYRELFHQWATDAITAARERFGLDPQRITYLGERPQDAPGLVDDRSTVEHLRETLAVRAETAGPDDRILILLLGHGTGQGEAVEFNLPGPDLTPQELESMISGFPTQSVALVNASSSSGPFLPVLSGPNRVVVTATRSAQERNETQFGGFFVEALSSENSDLNKDGRVSLAEAFRYAQSQVDRFYESMNLLATEHAQLDDDGDGEGATELTDDGLDGRMAESFWIGPAEVAAAGASVADSVADPVLRRLMEERADLERRVRELRALREQMETSRYEEELESLLVELALKNREIRERGGGS